MTRIRWRAACPPSLSTAPSCCRTAR
jgi:hypothetical protein